MTAHYRQEHGNGLEDEQIASLTELSAIDLPDERTNCPICLAPSPFENGTANHIANHLERVALFSLPRSVIEAENSVEGSGASQRLGVGSTNSSLSTSLNFDEEGHGTRDEGRENEPDTTRETASWASGSESGGVTLFDEDIVPQPFEDPTPPREVRGAVWTLELASFLVIQQGVESQLLRYRARDPPERRDISLAPMSVIQSRNFRPASPVVGTVLV